MNIIEKINKSRYTIKDILNDEWDTSSIPNLSNKEIEKMYTIPSSSIFPFPGVAAGCNFTLKHKFIPSHKLHIIYYNFPEIGRLSSKVTKSACDKIEDCYLNESIDINPEDSLFIIINDTISESLEKSFNELNLKLQNDFKISEQLLDEMKKNKFLLERKHFRNVHLFGIDSLTNNLLNHRLVPEHVAIRSKKKIEEILGKCNCNPSQLPIILKNDIISKLKRLAPGDICEIERTSNKCGKYPFYRICK